MNNFSYLLGPDATGTRDKVYVDIFTLRNFVHLNEVAIFYEATYGMSLSTVCINEFAKDMGNAMASIRTVQIQIKLWSPSFEP